jgi:hypothetical protein
MRNVHYTCDRCGEVIKKPGHAVRGEHDAPDVQAMIGNGTTAVCFDFCQPCLKAFVVALEIGKAKRAVVIRPGGEHRGATIGDALDTLSPWNGP